MEDANDDLAVWQDRVEKEMPKRKSRTESVPQLLQTIAQEEANYEWIWEGVIAKGHITLLSALFKTGKSTLFRCLLHAMYENEEFIGMPTKRSRVLIISEESASEWVQHREAFGLNADDATVWIWSRPYYAKLKYADWVAFITEDVLGFCQENKIDLVVLDTVSTFWAVTQENDAMDMEQNLKPFVALTAKKIAVFLIQQDNKGGGQFGRSVRGSSALPGFADEIITFGRRESDNILTRHREITFFGRLYNAEEKMTITFQDDNTYTTGLPSWQFSKKARMDIIQSILEKSPIPLAIKDIRERWNESLYGDKPHIDSVYVYVKELTQFGDVRTVDFIMHGKAKTIRYGLKNRPYQEGLLPIDSEYSGEPPDTSNRNAVFGESSDNNVTIRSDEPRTQEFRSVFVDPNMAAAKLLQEKERKDQ